MKVDEAPQIGLKCNAIRGAAVVVGFCDRLHLGLLRCRSPANPVQVIVSNQATALQSRPNEQRICPLSVSTKEVRPRDPILSQPAPCQRQGYDTFICARLPDRKLARKEGEQ